MKATGNHNASRVVRVAARCGPICGDDAMRHDAPQCAGQPGQPA
ncbi:hypothetical protein Y027_5606 [Burkholderia pseudomallei TSV5]|nr:hypothetical protein Y027_5606 [Burkholderia pseudomallei TSV5]KGX50308.1 hypothetical protein Y025_5446 [Burkholderia pseudomallei TSV32]